MRYTIITPTICRPTLARACQSVENQTCSDWEHIVMVDGVEGEDPEHPQRKIIHCERNHNDVGNTCRRDAWAYASGDYLYYLDDDNYLSHRGVLEELKQVTLPWALLPIYRIGRGGTSRDFQSEPVRNSPSGFGGHRLFRSPPHGGWVDTGSMLIRRDLGQWIARKTDTDAELAEKLRRGYPYQSMGHLRPVMIYRFAKGWLY